MSVTKIVRRILFATALTGTRPLTPARRGSRARVRADWVVGQHGTHEGGAASMRRTARATATTNHSNSNHNAVFVAAANAIPAGEDGAERNGPPRTNHQTVTPGCTNSSRGSLTTDGVTSTEASITSAAVLVIASTAAARSHHCRATDLMHAA